MSDFETPHPNGAAHVPERAHRRPPTEFIFLMLGVALVAILIIVGWVLFGSKSPERLAPAEAAQLSGACTRAQQSLAALPNSFPRLGADRVARIRAENDVLRRMVAQLRATHIAEKTPAAAVQGWSNDWANVIQARATYADNLQAAKGTDKTVKFVVPARTGVKPITNDMDDFVRENHPNLDACFTTALQLEVVEGPRTYEKVTQ